MELRLLRYFIAVAEEKHFGRAARRLQMTQPPLSRAIRQLEDDLGAQLLQRDSRGVDLTAAGVVLYDEARSLLEHADRVRGRVNAAAGPGTLAVGTLVDTAEQIGATLVAAFRQRHPHVEITIHETDLCDPSAGLRTGSVDVALTRTPFDAHGLMTRVLRSDTVGVVVRSDDPLASTPIVALDDIGDRAWVRLPGDADPVFSSYWTVPSAVESPVVRTIQECLRAVLWNGAAALAPVTQELPEGLSIVPVNGRAPSQLVVAWRDDNRDPLVHAFLSACPTPS